MSTAPTRYINRKGHVIPDMSRQMATVCTSLSREQFDQPEIRICTATAPNAPAGYQWPHLKTPAREL